MSVQKLSEESDIATSTIYRIEGEKSELRTHVGVAIALADTLQCDVSDLFEPEDLTSNGRTPHSHVAAAEPEKRALREMLCPDCFTLVPADIGCETCEVAPLPVT